MGLAITLNSSLALGGVTPINAFSGVSSVTISPQKSNGSGDLTGTNYGYANGLEQFAYYININYAGTVSDDQINTDFTQGITIDIDVPVQGGIKRMHLKMPTNNDTCLNEGQYIYPGFKGESDQFARAAFNGLRVDHTETYPEPQGNNWQCSNDSEKPCQLFYSSQDVIGDMNNVNQARVCLTTIQNNFSHGVDTGLSLNTMPEFNESVNSSKETRVIYIQAADFPAGAYIVGLTYTDDNNETYVVNENSGAQNLNIADKPRLNGAANICYRNDHDYGSGHHEHPGLGYRDYYIQNNNNSSIKFMPLMINVDKRKVEYDGDNNTRYVWGYGYNDQNIDYRYDTDGELLSSRTYLNMGFPNGDLDRAKYVTRDYSDGGSGIGTGGDDGSIRWDKDYVAYTAKNTITSSNNAGENYIELLYWGSHDSETDNDQHSMPQVGDVIALDQFGNSYYLVHQSLGTQCP
jgi:hypothetical protein